MSGPATTHTARHTASAARTTPSTEPSAYRGRMSARAIPQSIRAIPLHVLRVGARFLELQLDDFVGPVGRRGARFERQGVREHRERGLVVLRVDAERLVLERD